jgi:hypothetical protein
MQRDEDPCKRGDLRVEGGEAPVSLASGCRASHGVSRSHRGRIAGPRLSARGTKIEAMSDVIWAAIVAVAGSLLTGIIASVTTYRISRHQSDVALETVREQTDVELTKLGAENERLRAQHQEDKRRDRQATYLRLIGVMDEIDRQGSDWPVSDEEFKATHGAFNTLYASLVLFGEEGLVDAAGDVVTELASAGHTLGVLVRENPVTPRADLWVRASTAVPSGLVTDTTTVAVAACR